MSEAKPISQMMSELEMRADEYSRHKIREKTEHLKNEVSEKLLTDFLRVYCFIMNQTWAALDTFERDDRTRELNGIVANSLESMQYSYFLKMTGFLNESQRIMYRVFANGNAPEVYKNYLNGNVILPKLLDWEKTFENDYSRLALIPGENEMTLEEMANWSSYFLPIEFNEIGKNDIRETDQRPKKFYTIGINDWSKSNQMIVFENFQENAEKLKKQMKEINPMLSGMTEREYVWARICSASGLSKLDLSNNRANDREYASVLLGDKITQEDGDVYYGAGWLEDRKQLTLRVGSTNGALSAFPRFVMVFGGEDE